MRLILAQALRAALAQEPAEGSVEGWVFAAGTGQPVAGLQVQIGPHSVLTDGSGHFRAPAPAGEVRLVAGDFALQVPVGPGQVSEVLLTQEAGGVVYAQVEAPTAAPVEAPGATLPLRGRVLDADTGAPVAQAQVFVRGRSAEARTDAEGWFTLELPPGEVELAVLRSGYSSTNTQLVLEPGAAATLELRLYPADLELAEVTIVAPRVEGGTAALLEERKEAATVNEVLGAEEMARAGAADAAAALTRVTGLTLVGGRYIFVRGLGERYSATTLDGSSLPSPEPERRVVPLDLFPSATLDSVVVQKSWTPNLPGEFGGGALQLRSRGVPEGRVLRVGLSGGWDAGTTLRPAQVAPAGALDWLGVDDGSRAMPADVAQAGTLKPYNPLTQQGYTAEELERFGEGFTNRWTLQERTLPPNTGLSLTAGGRVQPGALRLGALGAFTYNNTWDHNTYTRTFFNLSEDGVSPNQQYVFDEVERAVRLGGMLALSAEWGQGQALHSTTAVNRSTDDTARVYEGEYWDGGTLRVARTRWVERQLFFQQLGGLHPLGERATLEWRYARSVAQRDEPGRLEWSYELEPGVGWLQLSRASGFDLFYGAMRDRSHDLGADLTLSLGERGSVQVGAWALAKDRASEVRRFYYELESADTALRAQPSEKWFTPQTIGPEGFEITEFTSASDDYTARQRALAGYAMADLSLAPGLRVVGGLRVEGSTQDVATYALFSTDADAEPNAVATLKTLDWLPALHATWSVGPRSQLRAGYARTVSRPDFRELSEVPFYDVSGGRSVVGNPELTRASLHHADLRWELYPRPRESLSLGLFYKRFLDPIETVVEPGNENRVTFQNAPAANNLGVELEARVGLPLDLFVGGNAALIRSRVDLSGLEGTQTSTVRPLQGQSPWVANVQLGYENPDRGTTLTLLYNAFGPRIEEVGIGGLPDTYERTVHRLDLVASQALPGGVKAQLKLNNLGSPVVRRTVGDAVAFELEERWSASLGLSWGL